ncbi:MAG: hypothetical protein IPL35_04780 [Sphingobacteriales bacterium]|nr:hypothetical protein [Sphingobacteriales bacterium]
MCAYSDTTAELDDNDCSSRTATIQQLVPVSIAGSRRIGSDDNDCGTQDSYNTTAAPVSILGSAADMR